MKKLNLNSPVKVKLTPLGKDIYYHKYDQLISMGAKITPSYPRVDEEGFTEFQVWDFINIYGRYMGMAAPNVITDLTFYIDEKELL